MSGFSFNRVYVIESLSDGDNRTGKSLYDDVIKRAESRYDGVLKTDYFYIQNRCEFFNLFDKILAECTIQKNSPILHLEIHGNKDKSGLVLQSKEPVSWEELTNYLSRINFQTGNKLFFTMAVCHGAHLMRVIRISEPAPFWGFIGSLEEIYEFDLEIRYNEFYEILLSNKMPDFVNACMALFKANTGLPNSFSPINTAMAFINGYAGYLREQTGNDEMIKKRALDAAAENGLILNDEIEKESFQKVFKIMLNATMEPYYKEHSRRFFMIDDYPENQVHFDIPETLAGFIEKYGSGI